MKRRARGFTLIEIAVVILIIAVLTGLVVWYGRSAKSASNFASGAWQLSLKAGALKARAMANAKDYLLVVLDAADPAACVYDERKCGTVYVLSSPQPTWSIAGFDPSNLNTAVSYEEQFQLPQNSKLDVGSTWAAPAPFNAVTAFDSGILATCSGSRSCFAIRYRSTGEVAPEAPAPPLSPARKGFAFVIAPQSGDETAKERRGLFISFPTGIVKTQAF
jgi:prepilin-type N-terminal cleavage/methylation domain-containing protein